MRTLIAFLALTIPCFAADLGQWEIDDALTFTATTHDPTTGVATDADAVPSYRVYEDETGTAILTGSMALLDSSNTDGFYSEQITLSTANGFEASKSYSIIKTASVGGVTGNAVDTLQITAVPTQVAAILADTSTDGVVVDNSSTAAAVWNAAQATYTVTGSFGEASTSIESDSAAILADTATLPADFAAGVRTALGMAAATYDTDIAAVTEAATAAPDTRDLKAVQWLFTLKRTSTGALGSTTETTAYVHPGDTGVRIGWDCDIPAILPGTTVLASMTAPTSDNADFTLAELGIGPNGKRGPMAAKGSLDVAADATPGEYTVTTTVTNDAGAGPITLYGKVIVLSEP